MLGTINPEILFLQQEDQIKAGLMDMKMILKITEDTYKMLGQGQIPQRSIWAFRRGRSGNPSSTPCPATSAAI